MTNMMTRTPTLQMCTYTHAYINTCAIVVADSLDEPFPACIRMTHVYETGCRLSQSLTFARLAEFCPEGITVTPVLSCLMSMETCVAFATAS